MRWRDHLRVCGADYHKDPVEALVAGSSPRVRSGPRRGRHDRRTGGIISACAERTNCGSWEPTGTRDHLRVCGADASCGSMKLPCAGSSPRVRSGLPQRSRGLAARGIISACAERTVAQLAQLKTKGDHLRVCGADESWTLPEAAETGSSPRVRSGLAGRFRRTRTGRIISACAERTACSASTRHPPWDHLRVCGADYRPA